MQRRILAILVFRLLSYFGFLFFLEFLHGLTGVGDGNDFLLLLLNLLLETGDGQDAVGRERGYDVVLVVTIRQHVPTNEVARDVSMFVLLFLVLALNHYTLVHVLHRDFF
uniref:Uncharacterized protein n=1 Tax=Anopheles atroparvus TaxID=41427 RepID=A0AAG5DGM1_ANOAO